MAAMQEFTDDSLEPRVMNGYLGAIAATFDKSTLRERNQSVKSIDFTIPESSRLEGLANSSAWSFRLQRILKRYTVWVYYTRPPSSKMPIEEIEGRELAMSAIEESVKDSVISIIRRF